MFQATLWSLPPLLTAAFALYCYRRVRAREAVPGGYALRFLFAVLTYWAICQFANAVFVPTDTKLMAAKLSYIGLAFAPVAWFLFALTYSRRVVRASRTAVNIVALVPAITIVLALTNENHHLVWTRWYTTYASGHIGLVTIPGFWAYVHTFYSYALILIGSSILTFSLVQFKQHRSAVLAAIFAPFIAVMANTFYLSPLNTLPWFDVTTLGFLAGVLILDRGILQHGLLNQLPVIRDRVVEQLADPVLVITQDGTIIDSNESALHTWPHIDILNNNIANIVDKMPKETLLNPEKNTEVTIDERAFEISTTQLDPSSDSTDAALVFRDVTERRRAQRELREMKNELERFAHTDALTGMFNRRFFMQRLNEEFERVRRHGSVLSVLIFDLDHFKNINDTYGHDLGDAVLVAVADTANHIKRVTDIACRLGGEEFALLLPETDKAGAIHLAHRLRSGIEDYPYRETLEKDLKVTASVGVATVSREMDALESILKIADRALYRAKNSGRNMVCFDEAEE